MDAGDHEPDEMEVFATLGGTLTPAQMIERADPKSRDWPSVEMCERAVSQYRPKPVLDPVGDPVNAVLPAAPLGSARRVVLDGFVRHPDSGFEGEAGCTMRWLLEPDGRLTDHESCEVVCHVICEDSDAEEVLTCAVADWALNEGVDLDGDAELARMLAAWSLVGSCRDLWGDEVDHTSNVAVATILRYRFLRVIEQAAVDTCSTVEEDYTVITIR